MRPRPSRLIWIAGIVWMVAVWYGALFVYPLAKQLSLPIGVRLNFWILFLAMEFLVLLVHELGHAAATWAVGYRLKVISVGPVTILRDARGRRHWQFDWRRVISGGGFIGAIPKSGDRADLRGNAALIVFAGPFVTLICGAAAFLILISLPGTALADWWEIPTLAAVLFTASFFRNMTPVGSCDGNRLLQLALRNRAGEEFLSLFAVATDAELAEESHANLQLDDEIASRARVVAQIRAAGSRDPIPLTAAYMNLGLAQFCAADPDDAEASMKAALDLLDQCRDPQPALEGNIWSVLCHIYHTRQQVEAMEVANSRALSAFQRARKHGGLDKLQLRQVVAHLHMLAGRPQLALDEIEAGLSSLGRGPDHSINRAALLRFRVECEFALGCPAPGLAAAMEAAAILRSPELWKCDRGRAVSELHALGMALWESGQSDGIHIISEAVAGLEGDEASLAARCRISLADMLRHTGRLAEAEAAIPDATDLPANKLAILCSVRARIRLAQHRFEEAINEFDRSIQLRREEPRPDQIHLAITKSGLAMALLGCGRPSDAQQQAQESLATLLPARHADACEPLVTLALIGWQRGEIGASERFEQGIRCLVDSPLLKPAQKARAIQEEAQRLRDNERVTEAARAEEAASELWRLAGFETGIHAASPQAQPVAP